MQNSIWKATLLSLALAGLFSVEIAAQDRTLDEFKEYVKGVASDQLDDNQLNRLANMVDKDSNGIISDAEFEDRMESFQKVMSGEAPKAEKKSEKPDATDRESRASRWEQMSQRMQAQLDKAGISPGNALPDVSGLDIDGEPLELADLKGHYSVIVSGCLT